jgi:glycerol-3-phosphate O-acyltransferase/dihydroxyacetone phosphate acyltransferase
VLRIFFRRIEVTGAERVPPQGPVLFVLNHPNGLIDPAFLLCLAPRRVSLLAKAPLFRMPVVGWFCRMMEAIPVQRRQDAGADLSQNRETFEAARRVLVTGGAIAIFPEGGSHDEPRLKPLKTGAARIALGAAAALGGTTPIVIVPAGLYYRAKQTFRSAALLYFGEPFAARPVPLAPGAEPPAGPVRELTARIEQALSDVTLQAERVEALALIARAQRLFSAADDAPEAPASLAAELELQRRFALGYRMMRERWPDRFTAIIARVDRYETTLGAAGVEPRHLTPKSYTVARVLRYVAQSVIVFALLLPVALAGAVVHYPAYRAVGYVATGVAKRDAATVASGKVLAAMLLFPVTWGLAAGAAFAWQGWRAAAVALALLPFAGYGALVFFERLDRLIGRARAASLFLFQRWAFLRLVVERRAIREEIVGLARELGIEAS